MRETNKKHLIDIERLTGLTILLVVTGHLVTGQEINTPGLEWYKFLKQYIYSFHMPLFMFVSGFLFYYTVPKISSSIDYINYAKKKMIRLFPSYIIFSVLIFIVKYMLSDKLKVDNGISDYKDYILIFYNPVHSFAGFLWYIYVLFQFYLVFPILLKYIKPFFILIISFALYFFDATDWFAINFFLKYFFFFSLGIVVVDNYSKYKEFIEGYKSVVFLAFLMISTCFYYISIPKLIMGLCSILGLHAFVLIFNNNRFKVLTTLGSFSFSIYLMNTLVMGFVKAIGFKYFEISYSNFFVIALLMVFLGTIIPMLVKKYFFNKIPKFGKYIG